MPPGKNWKQIFTCFVCRFFGRQSKFWPVALKHIAFSYLTTDFIKSRYTFQKKQIYSIFNYSICSDTYQLGRQQQFNAQLNETNKKFTYFVPRNIAWQNAKVEMPSAIKKLFMPDFAYHVSFPTNFQYFSNQSRTFCRHLRPFNAI